MKTTTVVVASALLVAGLPVAAKPITAIFRINIDRVEGAINGPLTQTFLYTATFDPSVFTTVDQGTRTNTNYVIGGSDVIRSDVFSLLPVGAQVATPYQIISGQQDDYTFGLLSQIGFGDQRYYDSNGYLGQTVTDLFFKKGEPSQGGNGTGDQPLTVADVRDILAVGHSSPFFLFDRIYDPANTRTTYTGTATILSVSQVPEPASWGLMVLGFWALGSRMRGGYGRPALPRYQA